MRRTNKKSTHSEVGELDVWDWVVTKSGKVVQITSDDMPELPYEEIERKATVQDMAELFKSLTPTKPVEITEEDVDELIKTICSLEDRINFYYVHKPGLVDEITKLEKKQRQAILTKLNGE